MAAGTSIFTLMGSILIDNDKANESISKTEGKAEGLAQKFGKGMGVAAKWGAAIGGAAIAGGTALFGMANKAADTTDRVDKLSQKIGISRTAFQEYEYVLSQSGASIEVMQRGMKTLVDRMDESAKGTGAGAEAFNKLKLSATDLNGELKSQEQMFEESAKALMAMPPGAEKSALAFDLFGKAGQELMPLLNGSAEGFDELKQAAHDMGLVISDDAIDAGVKFQDTMDNVKRSLGAVVANIGVQVMPMFQKFLDWVMDHMPEIQAVVTKVFEYIGIFVSAAVDIFRDYLIPIFQAVFDWTKENWPIIQAVIKGVFDTIKFVWDNVLSPTLTLLWGVFKSIVEWVGKSWPIISATFETVFGAIKLVWETVLKPVLDFFLEGVKLIVNFIADRFSGMQSTVERTFEGIGKAVKVVTGIFDSAVSAIKTAYDWLTKWNNTDAKKKDTSIASNAKRYIDGSYAGGIDYVPYDGHIAELHKGERVLTAQENKAYSQGQTMQHSGTIRVEGVNSSGELMGATEIIIDTVLDRLRMEVRMA